MTVCLVGETNGRLLRRMDGSSREYKDGATAEPMTLEHRCLVVCSPGILRSITREQRANLQEENGGSSEENGTGRDKSGQNLELLAAETGERQRETTQKRQRKTKTLEGNIRRGKR